MARIGKVTTLLGVLGTQNIFTHPLDFTHDGGEVVFNLPNGLQGYYLCQWRPASVWTKHPINIVSNPAASDPTVRNGLSCFGCHTEGMKTFEDQVRYSDRRVMLPRRTTKRRRCVCMWNNQRWTPAWGKIWRGTRRHWKRRAVWLVISKPISRFHEAFQGPVDVAYAAAVVGLGTEAFQEKIRENIGLQNIGLLVLASANGSMKRDAWTSSFRDIIFALDFPERFTPPPVITPPKPIPGTVVHIPDPGLRAAIAEELGKSPNAPITAEEMERLKELEVPEGSIQDLTGLQFATNLTRLVLGWWGKEGNHSI